MSSPFLKISRFLFSPNSRPPQVLPYNPSPQKNKSTIPHQPCAIADLFLSSQPLLPKNFPEPGFIPTFPAARRFATYRTHWCVLRMNPDSGKFGRDERGLEREGDPHERGPLLSPRSISYCSSAKYLMVRTIWLV